MGVGHFGTLPAPRKNGEDSHTTHEQLDFEQIFGELGDQGLGCVFAQRASNKCVYKCVCGYIDSELNDALCAWGQNGTCFDALQQILIPTIHVLIPRASAELMSALRMMTWWRWRLQLEAVKKLTPASIATPTSAEQMRAGKPFEEYSHSMSSNCELEQLRVHSANLSSRQWTRQVEACL